MADQSLGADLGIDPFVQQQIDRARSQQLAQQIAAAQSDVGNPTTMDKAIPALGIGAMNLIRGVQAGQANQQNIAMGNAIAGGVTPMAPLPPYTPLTQVQPGS